MMKLKPKLLSVLKGYTTKQFFRDLTAGVIVGIVALPLAIAFAIASGVSPEKGLITAVIAGFLISALGGSRVQIGGPTGAFVIIVYGIIEKYGMNGLIVATIMAGVILVLMGLFRFGTMIKFIPYPVIAGFTSGIAVVILSSQVKDLLGLRMGAVPADFFEKWGAYLHHITSFNVYALMIAAVSLLIIIVWPRVTRRIPGSIVALIVATVAVTWFKLPVETIGSRFGAISASFPMPSVPHVDYQTFKSLLSPALTIAMLAGIESLLSAVVSDGMIGSKHRSNMELVANGIANIVSPIFGGIPATGAIARTATNIKNGGRTPIAGMVHAITLLLIMLFFGKWASLIPLSCLAAVLVVVAYNMSEWRSFLSLMRSPRSDVVVLLMTLVLTVVFDLTVAIELGLLMAAFLFMRRMAQVTQVTEITDELEDGNDAETPGIEVVPVGVEVYEINGPLFFGAAHKFEEAINGIEEPPKVLIIRMRSVPAIDSTGLHTLKQIVKRFSKQKIALVFAEVQDQPQYALGQFGLTDSIGDENFCPDLDTALERAKILLATRETKKPSAASAVAAG